MSESFTSFDLPLKSDGTLFERYVNTSGGFRRSSSLRLRRMLIWRLGMGKLLERMSLPVSDQAWLISLSDLDSLAGAIAYRHCLPTPSPSAELDDITTFHEAPARARLYLATASADRLDMFGSLNRDLVRSVSPVPPLLPYWLEKGSAVFGIRHVDGQFEYGSGGEDVWIDRGGMGDVDVGTVRDGLQGFEDA